MHGIWIGLVILLIDQISPWDVGWFWFKLTFKLVFDALNDNRLASHTTVVAYIAWQ